MSGRNRVGNGSILQVRTQWASRGLSSLLTVVAILVAGCSDEDSMQATNHDGPLRMPDRHAWGHPVEAGVAFTDGLEVLRLHGDSSAVLDSVELVGDPEVELLGAMVLGPGREEGSIQVVRHWPPRDREIQESDLVPAEGATIDSDGAGWELLLGLRVEKAGRADRTGVKIRYTVDGERFTTVLPAFLRVCAISAGEVLPRRCNPPENWLDAVS